jgi:hypothetical protein
MTDLSYNLKEREIKNVSIVGARTQVINAAAVTQAINRYNLKGQNLNLKEILV